MADKAKNIDDLYKDIEKNIKLPDMVSNLKPELVTATQVDQFLKIISDSHGITPPVALLGVTLLFLKGACNNSAPNNMGIDLTVEKEIITLTKYDLQYACQTATGNKFLRRIAQFLAKKICTFAEKNSLSGDLAVKLNNAAIAKENSAGPLNQKEKAWACSFVQEVDDLSTLASPRLVSLLAEDYNKNLANRKPKKTQKKANAAEERKWRKGKKKATSDNKEKQNKNNLNK